MPKRVPKQELDRLAALLARHPAGLGITKLEKATKAAGLRLDRRTLQRRLGELIKAKRVLKEGEGRACRYLLAPITGKLRAELPAAELVAHGETYIPLSPEGAGVKDLVRRPIPERRPVGYNRAFLESYEPNTSAY
ncbi:MAG: Fic family protein, partial [Betaproteobacteria bacterium]|nr:Fic family protein [Betaproteobacteria bacterium]